MAEGDTQPAVPPLARWGLAAVAAVSVACAFLHAAFPDKFDDKTAMFLAVAAVALVFPQVAKFKGFGVEVEQFARLQRDVKAVGDIVGGLEKAVGPGSKSAAPPAGTRALVAMETTTAADADDPNKGRFGGSPARNGRTLSAAIEPLAGPRSARCRVTLRVAATDPARPLTGPVRFHLHPSFGEWAAYDNEVAGGVAEDKIVSFGAFTVGAEADDGATRLELDLTTVPGGTKRFYDQ